MPQISKIRIVNFNYNDGNRFIPDELYDLASPDTGKALNTLFNLNNGGGKTVLVQLMMQPVHPKAMAGGRRIEDYFSHTGDHSYILLEWNLDGSKEKLLTGISIAASSSASTEEDKRGNSVKYYTFTTHYDTFSAYSISSLELSSNDNGNYVPAQFDYVREKAKSSRGLLTYYSSDDAVKWAEFLAEYGIFRTEWESVIEVLNKDEGGLNQYFDEAKTSDKLIAKFFIPAIEQKLMSVASQGTDCSLETMLINYAKKIMDKESVIKQRDTNKKLLEDLEGVSEISDDLYNANDAFVANVSETRGFAAALGNRMNAVNEETGRVAQEIEGQNTLITRIDHEKKSKNYYVASEKRDRVKADMEEALALLEQSKATLEAKRHEEDILQSAKLYRQIQKADGKITGLKKLIEDKENHSDDAERIANLKYSVLVKAREAKSEQESIRAELEEKINQESATVKECQDAKKKSEAARDSASKRYTEAEAALNASKSNTDKRVANLQIDVHKEFPTDYRFLLTNAFYDYFTAENQDNITTLTGLVVVDEAHCISQWGDGFRPAYRNIPDFLDRIFGRDGWPATLCLTATLNEEQQQQVIKDFHISNVVKGENLWRKNLYLEILNLKDGKEDTKDEELERIIEKHRGEKILVFAHRVYGKHFILFHPVHGIMVIEQDTAVIHGLAGTGKTVLAIEKAKMLAEQGESVLFLCYNSFLRDSLRENNTIPGVVFHNAHSLAYEIMGATDSKIDDVLAEFEEYLEVVFDKENWKYKNVIVDEGQDLDDRLLNRLYDLSKSKKGSFYVFYDKNQFIMKKRQPHWLEDAECRLVLSKNCRNTAEIFKTACSIIGKENLTLNEIHGEVPFLRFYSTEKEMTAIVEGFLERMKKGEVPADKITILSASTLDNSFIDAKRKYAGFELSEKREPGKVHFTTIRKFKGLEAEAILVVDASMIGLKSEEDRRLLYVGVSRAKNYLEIAMNQDIADSELGDYLHALNPNRSLPRNKKGLKRLLNVDI